MKKMSFVAIALALWLMSVALVGFTAQALPNHVVTGAVYGPGGNVQPGAANPANAANAVFYSTNQPSYPLLTEPTLTSADGALPASFAMDVGASWDWLPGDEVVVVIETVRGTNGWTGVNYTTSVDGILALTGANQDIGSGTTETLPGLTLLGGSDYVNVTWTGLLDANVNIRSYTVYRGPSGGPLAPIGTTTQQPGASRWYNDTGLTPGNYCYNLAANYRRDASGGLYTTTGRSETRCTSASGAPFIVSTSPRNGDTGVARSAPVIIQFSKQMNQGSVSVGFVPAVTLPAYSWTGGTMLTVNHALFFAGQSYQVTVTGQDTSGNNLAPGPVPNPWTFTTNVPPTAVITAPVVGVCRTGGNNLDITWTMSDPETSTANLKVWLNYTDGVTTNAIAGPLTGRSSPSTYTWPAPLIDASVTIILEVVDGAGEKAQETSPSVMIDSTRPTVLNIAPPNLQTAVPTDAVIWLNFSEPMDTAASQGAYSIAPTVAGGSYIWSNGGRTLRIAYTSFFAASTQYTVTVGTGAKDACSPGLALASAFASQFTTGVGPATLRPSPPSNLHVTSATQTAVGLAWNAPTDYEDGRPLSTGDIVGYDVYRADSLTGTKTKVGSNVATTSYTDSTVQAGATYFYWVKAKHRGGQESDFSSSVSAATPAPEGISIWLLLIPIIVVLAIIGAILLARRRKPQRPMEAPRSQPMAPEPEAPAEEYTPGEEGGGGGETL